MKIKKIKIWLSGIFCLIFPAVAWVANPALKKLQEVGSDKGPYQAVRENAPLSAVIGYIIQGALAIVGSVFLGLMIYAGYNWMIARGDEEKVSKAKDTITQAITGIIVVIGAWAIWSFILAKLILNP